MVSGALVLLSDLCAWAFEDLAAVPQDELRVDGGPSGQEPQHSEVEEGVVEGAQGQPVVDLVRAVLAVPVHVSGLQPHRIPAQCAIEPAESAGVRVCLQYLLGEAGARCAPLPLFRHVRSRPAASQMDASSLAVKC